MAALATVFLIGNLDSILFQQRANKIADSLKPQKVEIVNTGSGGFVGRACQVFACLYVLSLALVPWLRVRVVFHGAYSPFFWLFAVFPHIKIVSILQGSELNVDYSGIRAKLIRLILKRSTLVVCRNEAQCVSAQKLCGVAISQCEVVHWGLNNTLFAFPRAARYEDIAIISPRATQVEYNIPLIAEAVRRLKLDGHRVRFVYIKFNCRINVDIANVVDELIDSPPQPVLWKAINSADICISIPNYDGLSNTVLEALALGVFPVFSDLQPYEFLKEDPRLGLPVALTGEVERDTESLYLALRQALERIREIRDSRDVRRDFAALHFRDSKGVARMLEVLRC